jgi:hypothetical protein
MGTQRLASETKQVTSMQAQVMLTFFGAKTNLDLSFGKKWLLLFRLANKSS